MKIALLDLNHLTLGAHNNTVPLGLGLIARYLEKTVRDNLGIKLYKETDLAVNELLDWQPDVVGISQYSWNSKLNLYLAKMIKATNPACLVVAGGPNLYFSERRQQAYFQENPFVDICISYDGEIPFAEIVTKLKAGASREELVRNPVPGTYAYDRTTNRIMYAKGLPPRLSSLNIFGTIYRDGIFDKFLDKGYHPFMQTHRGCPFSCAFCHTSSKYYTKMLFLSPEIFEQDLEYLAKKFSRQHEVVLYLANTNMSLFKEDFEIAKIIKKTQKRYDWPRFIDVNSGKDPDKLIDMLSIFDFQPAIALQSLTPSVLENIKRRNISFDRFIDFQLQIIKKKGEASATELILCLPGESKESFIEGLRTVLNSGVQNIVIYTLMKLAGTPLASEEFENKYQYVVRHRVVPRQFSEVKGQKILDTEEVVVGTNTMSFQCYLELRGLCFTIMVFFNSMELIPLKRLLIETGVDISEWVFAIHQQLQAQPDIAQVYGDFTAETKAELFESREDLLEFFDDPKNYESLCQGRYGDNLLRKYKCIVLSKYYKNLLEISLVAAKKLLKEKLADELVDKVISDLTSFLLSRDVSSLFNGQEISSRNTKLSFDVPRWVVGSGELFAFQGNFNYMVVSEPKNVRKAAEFAKMNRNAELSLQMLYRDGGISDFWPKWEEIRSC